MTRIATIDFDDAHAVARLWSEYAQIRSLRDQDPELLAILENLLPRIDPDIAAEIRDALQTVHPGVVLAEWQDVFFEAKFSTPTPEVPERNKSHYVPDPSISTAEDVFAYHRAKDREDPARLKDMVSEISRFTDDLKVIVKTTVAYAESCGIDESIFSPIIVGAIRDLQSDDHRVS